jgi:hypothetical protein
MMCVFYGTQSACSPLPLPLRRQSRGRVCIGIGGVRIDRAGAAQIVEAFSEHASVEPDAVMQARTGVRRRDRICSGR